MKNKCFEDQNLSTILPGVFGQAGLDAGLLQVGLAGPPVLHGNLREKQAPVAILGDDQTMLPHSDSLGIMDLTRGRQNRDLDLQVFELPGRYGGKAGILLGRIDRGHGHGLEQRSHRFDKTDASPQLSLFF